MRNANKIIGLEITPWSFSSTSQNSKCQRLWSNNCCAFSFLLKFSTYNIFSDTSKYNWRSLNNFHLWIHLSTECQTELCVGVLEMQKNTYVSVDADENLKILEQKWEYWCWSSSCRLLIIIWDKFQVSFDRNITITFHGDWRL